MDFEDINYEKTEKKVVKERPKIHLKIKTLSDFKRFTSKQLHKIVEKFREMFPLSKDLAEYNNDIAYEDIEYQQWLYENSYKK